MRGRRQEHSFLAITPAISDKRPGRFAIGNFSFLQQFLNPYVESRPP